MKAHSTTEFLLLLTFVLWFLGPRAGVAQDSGNSVSSAKIVNTTSGLVEFKSKVPLHSFTGRSQDLVGQIDFEAGTVDFYVDLATIKTGIGKRDKDMRQTLEVEKYPFAEFFGSFVTSPDLDSSEVQDVTVTGQFGIHGISREINVSGTMQREGAGWKLTADWSLLLADYDVVPPKLLFVKVDEKQEIHIETNLLPQ